MQSRTLRQNVTDLLRRAIIEGHLPPGAELNQARMAEKLGVSRGPLREALGQLEAEDIDRLNQIVDEMRQAAHEREARRLAQLDLAFHLRDRRPALSSYAP